MMTAEEIHSPGTLPNGLSVNDIVAGTSMPRNNFLFANAIYLLPYTGAGSGIQRALNQDKRLSFSNNESLHEFVITIERECAIVDTDLDASETDSDTFQQDLDTNYDTFETDSDTLQQDLDTNYDTSETDSDTLQQDLDTNYDTSETDSDTLQQDLDTNYDTFRRMSINNKQKDIVNYCSVPRSSREILERAKISYHTKNIDKYINTLVETGYLEMTNPENPNASNQKYRKKLK